MIKTPDMLRDTCGNEYLSDLRFASGGCKIAINNREELTIDTNLALSATD